MNNKPEALSQAMRRWAAAERASGSEELPRPEDLVAYREGRLDDSAREALERALALHPEAAREYLDLANFSHLEAPGTEHDLSDHDVQAALASLQDRISREGAESPDEELSPAGYSAATGKPRIEEPLWEGLPSGRYGRRVGQQVWRSALAASLVLVVAAGVWIARLHQELEAKSVPRFAAVVDVHPTRGERSSPVSSQAQEVMLVLHDVHLEPGSRGQLEITTSEGRQVLSQEIEPSADEASLLYVTLPRSQLPYGKYRLEIHELRDGLRHLVQEYALSLASPDATSPL